MRFTRLAINVSFLVAVAVGLGGAQQAARQKTSPQHAEGAPAATAPQTENIPPSQADQSAPAPPAPGFMEPARVKAVAHEIWLVEYRINDLLSAVHPEKWKISNVTRNSYDQTLQTLRRTMQGMEGWRAQFESRPDSIYYGFQTYAAMNAALPRLEGMAQAAGKYENVSLGAQYGEAQNHLFDLQEALGPYIAYLLRNPDEALYVSQTNLAGCQSQLGVLLRGQGGPAKPLKNTFVEFYPKHKRDSQPASQGKEKEKPAGETEKKAEPQPKSQPPAH